MFGLGLPEMVILLVLGVLLFGRKLPEVGRSLGKTLMEVKKGLHGLEDEMGGMGGGTYQPRVDDVPPPAPRPPQRIGATAPKFEDNPPASGPII
jgi:sec-independent protein translocase protein TatA